MTLAQLVAKPPQVGAQYAQPNQNHLDTVTLPGLEHLNVQEKRNLMSHLVWAPGAAWQAFDACQADEVLAAVLGAIAQGNPWAINLLNNAESVAGPRTVAWLETHCEANPLHFAHNIVALRILWKAKGIAALPAVARAWSALNRTMSRYMEDAFDQFRVQVGVSKTAWNLLMFHAEPDDMDASRKASIKEFAGLLERGAAFPAGDWKLLASHAVHSKVVEGLVFATEDRRFFAPPDWPERASENVSIAHAAMLSTDQIEAWKARRTLEPLLDQWILTQPLNLSMNPVGITAQPSELFLHLENRGWIRGRAHRSDGIIRTHTKPFPDIGVVAEIEYDGVPTRFGGCWTRQTIRKYRFFKEAHGLEVAIDQVHPVALATAIGDLAALAKAARK